MGNNPLGAIDPFGLETLVFNGGSPSSGRLTTNRGLAEIVKNLHDHFGEEILPVFSSGQTEQAFKEACALKNRGRPVFLIGHSWGGKAALEVARRLVADCGVAPDHVFSIDPFEAPDVKAPPGVPVTNFYQRKRRRHNLADHLYAPLSRARLTRGGISRHSPALSVVIRAGAWALNVAIFVTIGLMAVSVTALVRHRS